MVSSPSGSNDQSQNDTQDRIASSQISTNTTSRNENEHENDHNTTTDDASNINNYTRKKRPSSSLYTYTPTSRTGRTLTYLVPYLIKSPTHRGSALPAFICLLFVTCANYMLAPMRDAAALAVGVAHIPSLTLASTWLALISSVPIGWLFEAPDPTRRHTNFRKKWGFTRGETQGTSLALFYRVFEIFLFLYAIAFKLVELSEIPESKVCQILHFLYTSLPKFPYWLALDGEQIGKHIQMKVGKIGYVAFFLIVHLMKLHSISLIWGVTSEAMEYEEHAEIREGKVELDQDNNNESNTNNTNTNTKSTSGGKQQSKIRLKRLAFVGFGGTMGGILGSVIASYAAHKLRISGLLLMSAVLLEVCAELSIEIGRIMQRHWEEEQEEILRGMMVDRDSNGEILIPLENKHSTFSTPQAHHQQQEQQVQIIEIDTSLKRSASIGNMKRSVSGASINNLSAGMKRSASNRSFNKSTSCTSLNSISRGVNASSSVCDNLNNFGKQTGGIDSVMSTSSSSLSHENKQHHPNNEYPSTNNTNNTTDTNNNNEQIVQDDNSFKQRLLRGITTILRSKLLLTIFTYNALYASTTVLLSFQRAQLVANRTDSSSTTTSSDEASAESNTAFLAKINMASSVAVFLLQISGLGAHIANSCGQRGTLSLMPIVRLVGVLMLVWWYLVGNGEPPNLILFLVLDEFTRVINFAVAKPVRESLWRGLSNEARYEAKPIVDTLANRWGGGSAAFLVGCIDRFLDFWNIWDGSVSGNNDDNMMDEQHQQQKTLFGLTPDLVLLLAITVWWTGVSAHLGYVRSQIDIELKKHQ